MEIQDIRVPINRLSYSPRNYLLPVVYSHTHRIRTGRADLYDAAGGTGLRMQAGWLCQEKALYRFGMGNSPLFSFPVPLPPGGEMRGFQPLTSLQNCLSETKDGAGLRGVGDGRKEGGRRTKMRGDSWAGA